MKTNTSLRTKYIVRIALLAVMAYLLMLLEFPLPFAPSFLEIDISDVPAIIATFSMGIGAGLFVELIKNILSFITKSSTAGVGEIANFVIASAYLIPMWLVYTKKKTTRSALFAVSVATFCMVVLACFLNYFVLLPIYSVIYGAPIEAFVAMGTAINPSITNLMTLIIFAFVPFNLCKGVIISILGYTLYRLLKPILSLS